MMRTPVNNLMFEDPVRFMSSREIHTETDKYHALMRDVISRGLILKRNLLEDFAEEVATALVALKEYSERN